MSTTEAPTLSGKIADLPSAALEAWLEANVADFSGPFTVTKFPGGQSNPTYRIAAASGDYVLRRKPFGVLLPSAHAIDREYRLIAALHPTGYPVARPMALCRDAEVIGAEFYVMEMVHGRTFWSGPLPDQQPAERNAIYTAMVDTLARLHAIDPAAVGLGDFGRPGNFFARQVERWTRQYRAAQTETIEEVERLIAWLPQTLPAQDRTSIIHGDYRIDNLVFAADRPVVDAVLDWELATLGDPLSDFAYLALNWALPTDVIGAGIGGHDLATLGIPDLDAIVARYAKATGRDGIDHLDWHFSFALFRLVGIFQGIKRRMLDGTASSTGAAEYAARVVPLAKLGWSFAQRAGA